MTCGAPRANARPLDLAAKCPAAVQQAVAHDGLSESGVVEL